MKNMIARQIATIGLYIPVKITIPTKIRFPKILLNKLINSAGIAKNTTHIANSTATNPRTRSAYFLENKSGIELGI
jgi:hypothetical protein